MIIYNKLKLDLHGLTKEEAKIELLQALFVIDTNYNAIEVIHGYHKGKVLKDFVRKEFKHSLVKEKINIDASTTLLVLNWGNNG